MLTSVKTTRRTDDSHSRQEQETGRRLFLPDVGTEAYAHLCRIAKLRREEVISELTKVSAAKSKDRSLQSLKIGVAASLLRDLLEIGWEMQVDSSHIFIRPPVAQSVGERKAAIRKQLLFGRDDQLSEASNRRFLLGLERPSRTSSARPVTELIADGRRIAEQLRAIASLPKATRGAALSRICRPYLQLVSDGRDAHTNLRLIDIWRYFRHSWATRYRSSPGRNLFYLVRDAAQPNHPVMGIAALGNAVMQQKTRDEKLGWSVDGLVELCKTARLSDGEILAAFKLRLEEDYEQIYKADFPVSNAISENLNEDTLSRLYVIEQNAMRDRTDALKESEDVTRLRGEDLTPARLETDASSPLYRGKRARALREILRGYRMIRDWSGSVDDLARDEEGVWVLGLVIKQLKKRFGATSMMEITVCGAVAPYNHLLGGKLVCLMMMSPRVVNDYHTRYEGMVSIIASRMAGRAITKEPALVFLGTTSLYSSTSSQYNRVTLPANATANQRAEIAYKKLGRTEGYGSINLSAETEDGLAEIARQSKRYRNVNFVFGEGQSPKLRQLREGLLALGLDKSDLLLHGSERIIYGVPLATNWQRVLLGLDAKPEYSISPDSVSAETDIAKFWLDRWLASRLDHSPALDSVARSSPLAERVSRLIPEREEREQKKLPFGPDNGEEAEMSTPCKGDDKLNFIRMLYRNETAYSDDVSTTRLRELNIRTNLDEVIRRLLKAGSSVVITGNAGDGKTHALRLMGSDLKGAEVITDASEFKYEEIAKKWREAREAGRPFCIAINEGPLVELIREFSPTHSWLDEIRNQLLGLISYRPLEQSSTSERGREKWQTPSGEIVVIDLSQRHILSRDMSSAILLKLTDDTWYGSCEACSNKTNCAVTYNRAMLRKDVVRERVATMLAATADAGKKTTFREALGFTSYAIFGGATCDDLQNSIADESVTYYNNIFQGEGAIFELLERGVDPVKQTNPQVDEALWRGKLVPEKFAGNELMPVIQRNLDELEEREQRNFSDGFASLKRRWYFEHEQGRLVDFSSAKSLFQELQDTSVTMALRVGKLITLINRWWDRSAEPKADALRLWTRLTYHPRARNQTMVSGMSVGRQKLRILAPELSPLLDRAFGAQPIGHLILAPVEGAKFARLVVDINFLEGLLHGASIDDQSEIARRLAQFNDTLCKLAEKSADVRTIDIVDLSSELRATITVDLASRRYDTAS